MVLVLPVLFVQLITLLLHPPPAPNVLTILIKFTLWFELENVSCTHSQAILDTWMHFSIILALILSSLKLVIYFQLLFPQQRKHCLRPSQIQISFLSSASLQQSKVHATQSSFKQELANHLEGVQLADTIQLPAFKTYQSICCEAIHTFLRQPPGNG